MKRWEIRAQPGTDDGLRHQLLLEGGPADVAALIKRFGALCGRPGPAEVEGYNLAFVLHDLTTDKRAKLEAWLAGMAPAPAPAAAAPAAEAPSLAAPPAPSLLPPAPSLLPPAPAPAPAAHDSLPVAPPIAVPDLGGLGPPPVITPPPPAAESTLISLSPEPAPAPAPSLPPPPTNAPPAAAPAAAPASIAPPPVGVAPLTTLVSPLRSDWSFETLLVGAYNRFAHAAAMSVVSSPGSMYNPLFLYGVPGTGKSHMLHAIGGGLSKGLGDAVLLSTSGSRLSRATNAAIARNSLAELEKKAMESKALLVDDIHLLAVDDGNKEFLAKLFKSFFDRGLQVVITSLYPPRALNALEEALKFSFSKGWSVDLKIPSPAVQKELVMAAGDRANAGWNAEEMTALHEKLSVWGYADLTLWLRRLRILKKIRLAKGQTATMPELMALIYDPLVAAAAAPPTPEQAAAARFAPPTVSSVVPALAVLAPKGADGHGPFAASLFYEAGSRNGISAAFRHALWDTYDAAQTFGVPFQIGDMCARAGVTRLLLIGPGGDSPLAPRAMEFAHAVRRILESQGIQLGFIPFNGLLNQAQYINAQLDLSNDP